MAYPAPERLTLLPFPQAWTNGSLTIRVVALPRGTPMTSLMTGVPGLAGAPSFVLGASLIRGVPTPVVDLAALLGTLIVFIVAFSVAYSRRRKSVPADDQATTPGSD